MKGLYGLGIHRDALFKTLYDVVATKEAQLDIDIVTGTEIHEVRNGGRIVVDGEEEENIFDLVIVSDGRTNSLRGKIPGVRSIEKKYPWGCLWTILPDHTGEFSQHPVL